MVKWTHTLTHSHPVGKFNVARWCTRMLLRGGRKPENPQKLWEPVKLRTDSNPSSRLNPGALMKFVNENIWAMCQKKKKKGKSVHIRCTNVVKSVNGINLFFYLFLSNTNTPRVFPVLFKQFGDCLGNVPSPTTTIAFS